MTLAMANYASIRTTLVGFPAPRQIQLERLLRRHGHEVRCVPGVSALAVGGDVDLILVTVAGADDVVAARGTAAVIAMSTVDTDTERLRVLQAGCDDHLYIDCEPVEMMARIDAVLRWVAHTGTDASVLEHGPLRIDTHDREVTVDGRVIRLTHKEFDLLHLLASRSGDVIDRTEILDTVWQQHSALASRSLDTHASGIRRKVGRWACVTVKGYGLRIGSPQDSGTDNDTDSVADADIQ